MRNASMVALLGAVSLAACAGAPRPTEQLVETQSALRAAAAVGAKSVPQAQLHAKLAEEQVLRAQKMIDDDDNEEAARTLARAQADAELAIAMTRKAEVMQEISR